MPAIFHSLVLSIVSASAIFTSKGRPGNTAAAFVLPFQKVNHYRGGAIPSSASSSASWSTATTATTSAVLFPRQSAGSLLTSVIGGVATQQAKSPTLKTASDKSSNNLLKVYVCYCYLFPVFIMCAYTFFFLTLNVALSSIFVSLSVSSTREWIGILYEL